LTTTSPARKRAEQRHRILQQVGQHDRHPLTLFQPQFLLQPGGERPTHLLQFGIGHAATHVDEGIAPAELTATPIEHFDQRAEFIGVDVRRHLGWITFQPHFFHGRSPISVRSLPLWIIGDRLPNFTWGYCKIGFFR
jgi:hypothetical protein